MKFSHYNYFVLIVCFSILILYYIYIIMTDKQVYAIAVFNDSIKGTVKFTEDLENNKIKIDLNISGLKSNSKHGFHVHEA